MPLLTSDDPLPGRWPMWGIALVTLGTALFVFLAFHAVRRQTALGLEGNALRLATALSLFIPFTVGAWLERRRRAVAPR